VSSDRGRRRGVRGEVGRMLWRGGYDAAAVREQLEFEFCKV